MGTLLIAGFCVLVNSIFGFSELGLSKVALEKGEWFRILSFMFVHQNIEHLVINLASLILAGAVANEIGLQNATFLVIFFLVGISSAFLVLPFTSSVLVGASTGIYGIFGAITVKLGDYMSAPKVFSLFALAIAGSSLIENFWFQSSEMVLRLSAHLVALSFGAGFLVAIRRHRRWNRHVVYAAPKLVTKILK